MNKSLSNGFIKLFVGIFFVGVLITGVSFACFFVYSAKRNLIDRIRAGEKIEAIRIDGYAIGAAPFSITISESNSVSYLSKQFALAREEGTIEGQSFSAKVTLKSGYEQVIGLWIGTNATHLTISYADHDIGPAGFLVVELSSNAPSSLISNLRSAYLR